MTAIDTEAALLAAIRANPGEDAPRLVWADWLEENARTAACAACKGCGKIGIGNNGNPYMATCDECHGTGRVSDGRAELAEFVRVQVELAAEHSDCRAKGYDPCGKRCEELRRRERELWPAVQPFFRTMGCETVIDPNHYRSENGARHPWVFVSRGLPSVVRCTLAEWMGGECERCSGEGDVTASDAMRERTGAYTVACPTCHGTGRTPGIGPKLAQRWPVVAVEVTDRRSYLRPEPRDDEWLWFVEDTHTDEELRPYSIPAAIYELMIESHPQNDDGSLYLSYDSEPAARAAASDALIAWARGQEMEEKR